MKTHKNITKKTKLWFSDILVPWLNTLENYSFDKLVYLNNRTKIIVTCKRHGDKQVSVKGFRENPLCLTCINESKFLKTVSNEYPEYSFKETIFTGTREKIKVYCNIHSKYFSVNANKLRQKKQGCPECNSQTYTKENFIEISKKTQEIEYSYENSNYKNSLSLVKIKCIIHNKIFTQISGNHMKGICGCSDCLVESLRKKGLISFLTNSKNIHKDRYIYSNIKYIDSKTKVNIECRIHGAFNQTPNAHFSRGAGCPKCSSISKRRKMLKQNYMEEIIQKYSKIYDYSKTKYNGMDKNIDVLCKKHNKIFTQNAKNHIKGLVGCRLCQPAHGIDLNSHTVLYYFKVEHNNNIAYKIGITNNSVELRYTKKELNRISNIYCKYFITGHSAREEEKIILQNFKEYKYTGKEKLLMSGNTELFNSDILSNKESWWKHNYIK